MSRSAQVPTGWEVTLDLVRSLTTMSGEKDVTDLEAWYTSMYGKAPDYSELLGALAKTPAERRALLQGYFEPTDAEREAGAKVPTPAHRAIARLVARGFVRVVLTTNFDKLMETALRDEGVEPSVVSTADGTDGAAPIVHQRCLVVKLHGDYLDDRIKNTEAELGSCDPRMDSYLDRILDEFGLIVCGWSGEWDPALRAALERCKSRRYTMTWVAVGRPNPKAESLIRLRWAQVVISEGADRFFSDLEEKATSVAELKQGSPTSAATAIASLKRYVAEDRHRVRFEDLLLGETSHLTARLQEDFPVDNLPEPTAELMLQRLRGLDAATETLRAVYFHACCLANPIQEHVLLRVLALLIKEPQRSGAFYQDWTDLASYPVTTVLYSGALGAIASGNWRLLHKLFLFKYRVQGEERLACDRLAAWRLPERVANALFLPQKCHAAASRHLARAITPLARGLYPEPDLLFDELEVWVALAYVDFCSKEKISWPIFPVGRFCWQHHFQGGGQPSRLFEEAEAQGEAWIPLSEGWFGGELARWQTVKGAFIAQWGNRVQGRI